MIVDDNMLMMMMMTIYEMSHTELHSWQNWRPFTSLLKIWKLIITFNITNRARRRSRENEQKRRLIVHAGATDSRTIISCNASF